MGHLRRLAGHSDFTVLWIGQTISELGTRMSLFVFPLLTYALTGSTTTAALAEALHLLGLALALLPAGLAADRVDRRRLMRCASGTGVLLYASLAVAGALGTLTLPHLLSVALLTGAGTGVFLPAESSAVRTVVPPEDLPAALAQQQARLHVAGLLGGPLGGAAYAVARWLPFAVDAVTFAVSWVLLGRLRADLSPPPRSRRGRPLADLREGARYVAANRFVRTLAIWAPLSNLAVNALVFVAVLRLVEAGTAPWQLGLVETAAGACGILGALLAPRIIDRLPTGVLTIAVAWSFVPLVVPMALWNHPAVLAAALGTGLLLNPAGNAGIGAYRVATTPAELVGRVQSVLHLVSMSTLPLAPVLAGPLLAAFDGRTAVLLAGSLTVAAALVPTLSATVRAVPRPAEWQRVPAPAAAPARV